MTILFVNENLYGVCPRLGSENKEFFSVKMGMLEKIFLNEVWR
jgi:hypothetical protein